MAGSTSSMTSKTPQQGWVIARGSSNRGFTLHNEISRPLLGYFFDPETNVRLPRYGSGPACYTPIETRLAAKNQYTRLKRENRSEKPIPLFPGYTFILNPEPSLIRDLKDRGAIYGLIPDPRSGLDAPVVLSQRAIELMRNKYKTEYDPKTGAGYQTSFNPKAAMSPGHEFDVGDYVVTDDPAWIGHKLLCVEVLDTTARVIMKMFGVDMEIRVGVQNMRKAG